MLVPTRMSLAFGAALFLCLVSNATAMAGPISVNLRVEGSAKTLYEGPVSTAAIPASPGISTPSSAGAHPCDVKDNGGNEGFGAEAANPTAALYDAVLASGLTFDAGWSSSLHDFFITQVGTDIEGGPPNYEAWGYAVNFTTANVGGCQFQLAPGSEVLWAYNYFNLSHLLSLSGPTTASVGTPISVHVADGRTGEGISGASIGEDAGGVTAPIAGATTDASGNATIALAHAGTVTLKATRADSVRSAAVSICVHNGNDGTCGTTVPGAQPVAVTHQDVPVPPAADVATIGGVKDGRVYSRRHAPRVLRGIVTVPVGGTLRDVRISLRRRVGNHCFVFSGARAAFVRARCGTIRFFSVGSSESFSYLLPAPLPTGHYAYEIEAIDGSGHPTKLVGGVSRLAFRVR
jgi:hypothetical protein